MEGTLPRQSKGPRLWLRKARRDKQGRVTHPATWIIRDGERQLGTGCGAGDREGAEKALAAYIGEKYEPARQRGRDPSEVRVADVLNIYLCDKAPSQARPQEAAQRAVALLGFWGTKRLSDMNEHSCRRYVLSRAGQPWKSARPERTGNAPRLVSETAARRELEDLRAAVNYHHKQGLCSELIQVWLPEKHAPRNRWLTREEAARMLWALWRARDPLTGAPRRQHIARFFLVALYTGTRAGAVCGAAMRPTLGHGYVDLDAGLFYRKPPGARETNKRQPPVPLPDRLLAHLRRWERLGLSRRFIVEWRDEPVRSIRTGWDSARRDAGLDVSVNRHVLRHTAATWLMQTGTDMWEAAGYLGMSVEMLARNYGHHHPSYQRRAAENIAARPPQIRHRNRRTETEQSAAKGPGKA
jgi:integrase